MRPISATYSPNGPQPVSTQLLFINVRVTWGLLPLLFGEASGKEMERPIAYVILGGLVTSTFLNMVVVPTLYLKWGFGPNETPQQ